MLKIPIGHDALAYYLYENKKLTEKIKKSFYYLYFKYAERFKFYKFDLKAMHVEKDITN